MFDHEDFNTQTVHLSKSSTHLSVTDLVHIQFVPNSIHILSLPFPVHITCKSVFWIYEFVPYIWVNYGSIFRSVGLPDWGGAPVGV